MKTNEFVNNYIMHDSLIESIRTESDNTTVIMIINFAFWMQKGYKETDPETGLLKVTFHNVSEFVCPDDLPLNETSILKTSVENERVRFAVLNDMTDDYYDLYIKATDIDVQPM